jgi:hypothetical protein
MHREGEKIDSIAMLIHITKPDEPPVTRKFEQKDLF